MQQKYISLRVIESAIKANCLIDQTNPKRLMLHKHSSTQRNKTVGRALFIYFASSLDYNQHEICNYLGMTSIEWQQRMIEIPDYLVHGKQLYEQHADPWMDNAALLFYRKYQLVRNYLKMLYGYKIEEPA